ncbi:hypothetical protein [Afipia sp. GAS231]|uniref:hypothetical protein n=1 Tax=Afipia sp. GAS231 TaxID=1882747 RepID=UPI0008797A0E|nr:hypothetical protein [Afipia sp. GAS231]SDO19964.1 hypothetical protein SAMN05444050_3506 [Afipia sp. GAS231]
MTFEQRFKKDMLARFDRAEAAMPGYEFKVIRDLIETHGAVATAKRLLDINFVTQMQYGFEALAEQGLLDCSIEQATIDHESSGAFTATEIDVARTRLMIVRRKKRK